MREVKVSTLGKMTPCWTTTNFSDAKVVFVLAHGYGGTRARWVPIMNDLEARGISSIAVAMPGQDASPFSRVGFGETEAEVLVEVVNWILAQRGTSVKIVLCGVSMGGAASWLAGTKTDAVDGIVTEAAFARFDESIDRWLNRVLPGGQFLLRPVVWIASARTGIQPSKFVPESAAKMWKGKPALVIHGVGDTLITLDHGKRLSTAAGCELWTVLGAAHVSCCEVNPKAYVDKLSDFAAKL